MKLKNMNMSYFAIVAAALLVVVIFTFLGMQNRQVVENQTKQEIGKAELFAKGIQRPQGLAMDTKGRLFNQSSSDGKITVINRDGKSFDYAYLKHYNGYGIEIDKNDNIMIASGNKVIRVDSFGRLIQEYGRFKKAYDIELTNEGYIFATDSQDNKIYKIAPEGYVEEFMAFDGIKSSSVPNATGLCFDKDYKNLYCVNMYTGELYKIRLSEGYKIEGTEIIASGLHRPNFIDIDEEGNLYITCLEDNTVLRVDQNSIVENIDTGGKLSAPGGIVFDGSSGGGSLYVASKDTNSIYKINVGMKNKAKK